MLETPDLRAQAADRTFELLICNQVDEPPSFKGFGDVKDPGCQKHPFMFVYVERTSKLGKSWMLIVERFPTMETGHLKEYSCTLRLASSWTAFSWKCGSIPDQDQSALFTTPTTQVVARVRSSSWAQRSRCLAGTRKSTLVRSPPRRPFLHSDGAGVETSMFHSLAPDVVQGQSHEIPERTATDPSRRNFESGLDTQRYSLNNVLS